MDARRDSLVLPNLKNPSRLTKQVFLPAGQMDLPGALLLWAKEHGLADDEPLFFSRKRATGGERRPISRQQAWEIVRVAAEKANVRVLALRASSYGQAGEPAPVHPHLFRHARVRQIVRTTKSLPIAQKQAAGVDCRWPISLSATTRCVPPCGPFMTDGTRVTAPPGRAQISLEGLAFGDAFGGEFFIGSDLVEQFVAERGFSPPPRGFFKKKQKGPLWSGGPRPV